MMRADEVNGHAVKSYVGRHVLRVKLLGNCNRMVYLKGQHTFRETEQAQNIWCVN